MEVLKLTRNHLLLMAAMLRDPDREHYALELSDTAGVSVGSIYAALGQMQKAELVSSALEDIDPSAAGRPARRYYRLTALGRETGRQALLAEQRRLNFGGQYA